MLKTMEIILLSVNLVVLQILKFRIIFNAIHFHWLVGIKKIQFICVDARNNLPMRTKENVNDQQVHFYFESD